MFDSRDAQPPSGGPWSGADGADPDATLPESLVPSPTTEIVFPQSSADGADASEDAMASLFPHGVVVIDFRAFAPAVLLRRRRAG